MEVKVSRHSAILAQPEQKIFLKRIISLKKYRIGYFTEDSIKELLLEESKRDTSVFLDREGQTLRSMSSGERKVALFHYLLLQNLEILIVENFFEHLDVKNRTILEKCLDDAMKTITVIQIVRKKTDLFSFVKALFVVGRMNELMSFSESVDSFFSSSKDLIQEVSIPDTTTNYEYDYKNFVKLTDVNVCFLEKPIIKNINWEIKLGEFWQLIGENGTGKTTLLSLITGDSHKAYGQDIILFDKLKGTEENVWEIKQKIGCFTPNITELFNKRHSALHMILSGFYDSVGLYVKPLDYHISLAKEWLELIGMSAKGNKTFATLSLSEQRLVLIARAMVKHPPLLILDEPTSGLNEENTSLIVNLINKISSETKTTIIYVSHLMEKGLIPDKTFKLTRTAFGSEGKEVI